MNEIPDVKPTPNLIETANAVLDAVKLRQVVEADNAKRLAQADEVAARAQALFIIAARYHGFGQKYSDAVMQQMAPELAVIVTKVGAR